MKRSLPVLLLCAILASGCVAGTARVKPPPAAGASEPVPVIWTDPGQIETLDLRQGPTSSDRAPAPPFKFVEEDKGGTSPKFWVTDARNMRWQVKLGVEAQPETVATRLVWAMGYFVEEAYYLEQALVTRLPRLSRGREHTKPDGTVLGARFEPRHVGVDRTVNWDWAANPFVGTRELNGLKVLMVLLNNFDPLTRNNGILLARNPQTGQPEARYLVSDLGATLGGLDGLGGHRSKNNLQDFARSRFIEGLENGNVDFDYHTRPRSWAVTTFVLYPPYYWVEVKKERDMKGVAVEHARWIGSLLARLSPQQLAEALRAADYDDAHTEGYVRLLRKRTRQLEEL